MKIRNFEPHDLEDAYEVFRDAFHHIEWPIIDHASPKLIKDIILMAHRFGTRSFVLEIDDKVRGLLIVSKGISLGSVSAALRDALTISLKILRGDYAADELAVKHLINHLVFGPLIIFLHPIPDAEIVLFCIHSKFRGKGYGRKMVNLFFDYAKPAKNIYVVTNSVLDWPFYEKVGFRRIKEWKEYACRYSMPRKKVMTYLYHMRR